MRLRLDAITVIVDDAPLVNGIDLYCEPGELVGLLGPNGSGKTTALKTIYRAIRPTAGAVYLGHTDLLRHLSARAAARQVAVMTQEPGGEFPFTVREVVAAGRIPHKGLLSRDGDHDQRIINCALDTVGMSGHGERRFTTLSGGEKQRVLLARALAQQPRVLVLDEPTNHLDIATQLELLMLIRSLGITVLAALHDLNLAAAYCDRVYLLRDGHLVAGGPTEQVLTSEQITEVFGVHAHCGRHPATGRLHLAFSPMSPDGIPSPGDGRPGRGVTAAPATLMEGTE
jgi:iron complex transport system ATP-binding protein